MLARPLLAAVVTATAAVVATSALAAPTATTVTSAVRTGALVTASGTAVFDGATEAVSVGGTNTAMTADPAAGPAGVQLEDALIAPLEDGSGLRFIWQLESLPAQVPPEGTRYTWSFGVGDKTFQLQAKRTNLASLTVLDDAAGHAGAVAGNGFFQLRGNCVASYQGTPVSNCPHIAFLSGAFNTADATVTMDVPFGSQVAPEIQPGAVITEVQTASMSITAAFQAVASNTFISDYTNGWSPYYVGGNVAIGTGPETARSTSVRYVPATLDGEHWSGTVDRVADNHTTLFVRSCEAATCTYTSAPLS
jgi:hypothetical protein